MISLGLRRPLSGRRWPRCRCPTLPDQERARCSDHGLASTAPSHRCHRRAGKVYVALLRLLRLGLRLRLQLRTATRPRHAARVSPRLVTATRGCPRVLLARPEQVRGAGWGANQGGPHHRPPTPAVRLLAGRRHLDVQCGARTRPAEAPVVPARRHAGRRTRAFPAQRRRAPSSWALAGGMAPPGRPSSRLDRVAERDLALAQRLHWELNHTRPQRGRSDVTVRGQPLSPWGPLLAPGVACRGRGVHTHGTQPGVGCHTSPHPVRAPCVLFRRARLL